MAYTLIVDRIEEDIAVCEGPAKAYTQIPLSALPRSVREGDCLRPEGDGYIIDKEETARRRAALKSLFDRLKEPR